MIILRWAATAQQKPYLRVEGNNPNSWQKSIKARRGMFPAIGESPTMLSKGGISRQWFLPRRQLHPTKLARTGTTNTDAHRKGRSGWQTSGSLALHTSIYISFSRFGRTKTLLAYKGRGKMFCGMRSPQYKMTASTYGECGNAWYDPFASEEIWRTGSTPVFRD